MTSRDRRLTCADADNDGDDDLLVAVSFSGPAEMLINLLESGGKFVDQAVSAGIDDDYTARMGIWFDYNNDGLLDLLQQSSGGFDTQDAKSRQFHIH